MANELLSADQITALATELPEWALSNGKLKREIKFADFNQAFGFMRGWRWWLKPWAIIPSGAMCGTGWQLSSPPMI